MAMVLTQGFRKSTIITDQDKDSIEGRYKTGMELEKILYSILRRNIFGIRNSSISNGKNYILGGSVGHKTTINPAEDEILEVIFSNYKEFFSEFCY